MTSPTGTNYYRDLVESAPDAVLVVNQAGVIELVNRQAEALFGYAREELLGQPVEILVPDQARDAHPTRRESYFADPRTRPMGAGLDLTARRRDGTEVPVDISLSPLETDNGIVVSVAIRDVTERKRSERALQEAYSRLAASVRDLERHDRQMTLINEMGDMLQSCVTGAEANVVITRFAQLLFPGSPGAVFTVVSPAGLFELAAAWGPALDGPPVFGRDECWGLRRSRAYAVTGPGGGPTCLHVGETSTCGYVCVPMMAQGEALGLFHVRLQAPEGEDGATVEPQRTLAMTVAEHLALALANFNLRETLRHQSVSDPLTGLFNRRYLNDHLAREIRRAARLARPVGVIVADVDRFKEVNDRLGHGIGDEVLRSVARALESNVREQDTVCRLGGDEFVVILSDAGLVAAEQRAHQVRNAVRKLQTGDPRLAAVSLSMGIAVFPDHGSTPDELMRAADAALYRAKERGRDMALIAET